MPRSEFEVWYVHDADAGGPQLTLKVRYRNDQEVPDWANGPDLAAAVEQAEREGWHLFDREPGTGPGEYAIFHFKRER